jgi:hypothetical protein
MALSRADRWLAVFLVAVTAISAAWLLSGNLKTGPRTIPIADPNSPKLGPVWVGTTAHFEVTSRATVAQTGLVGSAAEALMRAYLQFFQLDEKAVPKGGLKLNLFKNRAEFKARVTGAPPWAEALYRKGVSYAYYDASGASGYHWMLHETTHQLNELVGHTPRAKWVEEGLACYFGASAIEDNALVPGHIEAKAYPVWWLEELGPSGDAAKDFASGRVVPLRALITGQGGPPLDTHVNQWYLGYWSLVHFLLHGEQGKYAAGFHKLLAGKSATLADFERDIGPVDALQAEWYRYLQGLAGGEEAGNVIVVD